MHEVHKMRGRREDDFEAAFWDGWMPMLAGGDDARLLWYADHAHDSNNYAALVHLLTNEIPPEHRAPGSYMFDALKFRDQWESRLLRTSDWSPLY
ncbi:hypothetical protein [Mycobacterium colombiense]|nr:hypothetical protein [Mycobacterium colombiense]